MKTVVTSAMVAHLWASQNQDHARNPQRSLFYTGSVIYSYGGHFPIAKHSEGVVLITTRRHSVTTGKHLQLVKYAANHKQMIPCANVLAKTKEDHTANLAAMRGQCLTDLEKSSRARTNAAHYYHEAKHLVAVHAQYRALFGKGLDAQLQIAPEWKHEAAGRIAAQAALTKERAVQAGIVTAQRLVQKRLDLEEWKGNAEYVHGAFHSLPVALRASEDGLTIETSHGAQVPATHAQRIWRKVQQARTTGQPYQRNGHTERVGTFDVTSIGIDGTVIAGCHTISVEAMQELAGKLGW